MDEKNTNITNSTDGKKPSPPPIKKGADSANPPIERPQETKRGNLKLALILIPVILIIIAGAITGAVLLSKNSKPGKGDTTAEATLPPVVYATYENGIAVTDDSGMVVTLTPETTAVAVTQPVTVVVTEKIEEVITQQVTAFVTQSVTVPVTEVVTEIVTQPVTEVVTDQAGQAVTNAAGEVQTTINYIPVTNAAGEVQTTTSYVPVTNSNGEQQTTVRYDVVTDAKGEEKTTIKNEAVTNAQGQQQTTVKYDVVTDAKGEEKTTIKNEAVTDSKGNKLTTVVYENVDVTVNVPVTNNKGENVTNSKGETETQQVVIPQNPNDQKPGGSVILGTTAVAITDAIGNTAVDESGDVFTTVVEITSNPSTVEPAAIKWKTALGGTEADYFSSIDSDKDGNFIATNVTNSINGDFTEFAGLKFKTPYTVLVKYDKKGDEIWRKAVGSKSGLLVLNDIIVNEDGSFYAVGYGKNVGGINAAKLPGKGYYDAAVYKFDKDGNEVWHKVFGTSTVDVFNAATPTSDGGVIVVGSVGNNDGDATGFNKPEFQSAACIVKYNSKGDVEWKNIVGGNTDTFNDVCIDKDGNIFCVGNFASGVLFPCLGKTDGGVVKFTSKGKFELATPLAGTGNDLFSGITACKTGGVVVVGRSNSNDISSPDSLFIDNMGSRGGYDAYIIKLDDTLGISFAKPFRGQYDDNLVDIVEKEDGSFVAVGCSNSSTRDFKGITTRGGDDIVIASFDLYGNLTWARSFGGTADESAYAVCVSPKGGYAVAGRTLSKNIDMAGIAQYVSGKSVGVIVNFPE